MRNQKSLSLIALMAFVLVVSFSSCARKVYVPAPAAPVTNNDNLGFSVVDVPCQDEAYDKPGEYITGLGVANNRQDMNDAMSLATQNAQALIIAKYVGVIKNAIKRYNKDTTLPSGQRIPEALAEGGQRSVGMKVIEKFATTVCHRFVRENTGGWGCFVVIHIAEDKIKEAIKEDLAVRKVDYDADKFFKEMDKELNQQKSY